MKNLYLSHYHPMIRVFRKVAVFILFLVCLGLAGLNRTSAQSPQPTISPEDIINNQSADVTELFEISFDEPVTGFIQSDISTLGGSTTAFTDYSLARIGSSPTWTDEVRAYHPDGFYFLANGDVVEKYDSKTDQKITEIDLNFSTSVFEITDIDFSTDHVFITQTEKSRSGDDPATIYKVEFNLDSIVDFGVFNGFHKIGVSPSGEVAFMVFDEDAITTSPPLAQGTRILHQLEWGQLDSDLNAVDVNGIESGNNEEIPYTEYLSNSGTVVQLSDFIPLDIVYGNNSFYLATARRVQTIGLSPNTSIQGAVIYATNGLNLNPPSSYGTRENGRLGFDENNNLLYFFSYDDSGSSMETFVFDFDNRLIPTSGTYNIVPLNERTSPNTSALITGINQSQLSTSDFLQLSFIGNRFLFNNGVEVGAWNQVYRATFSASGTGAKTISVNAGVATGIKGNSNLSVSYTYTYDPSLVLINSFSPTSGATLNNVSADLTITFNQTISKGSGTIDIYDSNDVLFESIDVSTSQATVSGTMLTISPTNSFAFNEEYYVLVDVGAVTSYAGITGTDVWTFKTGPDLGIPTIISFDPPQGTRFVRFDYPLTITFSEPIQEGAGSVQSVFGSQNFNYDVADPQVTIDGNQLIITPDLADVATGSSTIILEAGVVEDLAGNPIDRLDQSSDPNFSFTYSANNPPQGIALSNNSISENVAVGSVVGKLSPIDDLTFEDDYTYTVSGGTGASSFAIDGDQLVSEEIFDFEMQSSYAIQITITDLGGGSRTESFSISILNDTNEDDQPPVALSFDPEESPASIGVFDLATNPVFTITFDEDVRFGNSGEAYVHDGGGSLGSRVQDFALNDANITIDGNEVSFTITPQLQPFVIDQIYYLYIGSGFLTDIVGNSYAGTGFFEWRSRAADTTSPIIISLSPDNGSINSTDRFLDYTITFDEEVEVTGTGTAVLYDENGNVVFSSDAANIGDRLTVLSIGSDRTQVVIDQAQVNSYNRLSSETSYYIEVDASLIADPRGNPFSGISGSTTWRFTTSDFQGPQVVSKSPANDATDVPIDANFLITFDEPIQLSSDNTKTARIIKRNTLEVQEIFNVDGANVSLIGDRIVRIDPVNDMDESDQLGFFMSEGFVEDLNGNKVDINELNSFDVWEFFTQAPNNIPTDIQLDPSSITEGNAVDDVIGSFTATDADADTHAYALVAGTDDDDNDSFSIVNDELLAAEEFDYETKTSYSIRVSVDDGRDTYEKPFTISIVNDPSDDPTVPVRQSLSPAHFSMDVPVSTRDFTITFDIPVRLTSDLSKVMGFARIDISEPSVLYNPDDPAITVDGTSVTLTRNEDLVAGARYALFFQSGFIESTAGLSYTGNSFFAQWNFTVESGLNEWNGTTWSDGIPTEASDVLFLADYDFEAYGDLDVNSVTTVTNLTLTVEPEHHLIINGDLTIGSPGSVVVESGASLLTLDGNSVTGNITVRRKTSFGSSDRSIGKYSFMSIPVAGTFETQNLGDLVYEFNEADEDEPSNGYSLVSSGTNMNQAQGYAVAFSPEEISFVGTPNTGDISFSVPAPQNSGFHLVGNPYSAAISVSEFFNDNSFASSIAIWDDGGAQSGGSQVGSFVQVNDMGSVTVTSNLNSNTYNNHIGSAQGFFVETTSGGDIVFQEDQRVSGNNADDAFFRSIDIAAVKLSISDGNLKKETLIALHEEATDEVDVQKDAALRRSGYPIELYSLIGDEEFAIQARFPDDRVEIPLGFSSEEEGAYSIELNEMRQMDDYRVTLIDHSTGSEILIEGELSYSFQTAAGTFDDRFTLDFVKKDVILNAAGELSDRVQIIPSLNGIEFRTSEFTSGRILIHTLDGKELLDQQIEVNGSLWLDVQLSTERIYLIKFDNRQLKVVLTTK